MLILGHKKFKSDTIKPKRQLIRTMIKKKKEIIAKYETGVGVTDYTLLFKMPRMTISMVVRRKEAIKAASVAKDVKSVSKQLSQTLEEVEKLLYIWINEKHLTGDSIPEAIICEKPRQLHVDLLKGKPGRSGESADVFKASHGWFDKFKKRTGIPFVVRQPVQTKKLLKAATEFRENAEAKGSVSQRVFNCNETGLFRKKMPNRTYIIQEENVLPGHKGMKERLTLLCQNAKT